MKSYVLMSIGLLLCSCQAKLPVNVPELSDGNPTTCFVGTKGVNKVIFDQQYTAPFQSYKIYSSGETPAHDPSAWTLKGSFASVVLRIVFINLSMQRKFGKFKRQVFVISNKDLLNSL